MTEKSNSFKIAKKSCCFDHFSMYEIFWSSRLKPVTALFAWVRLRQYWYQMKAISQGNVTEAVPCRLRPFVTRYEAKKTKMSVSSCIFWPIVTQMTHFLDNLEGFCFNCQIF